MQVAPPESHELAEAVLKAQGAHVPRTCLLRRVNAPLHPHASDDEDDVFVPFLADLEKAGYQGNKLSVWLLQVGSTRVHSYRHMPYHSCCWEWLCMLSAVISLVA